MTGLDSDSELPRASFRLPGLDDHPAIVYRTMCDLACLLGTVYHIANVAVYPL